MLHLHKQVNKPQEKVLLCLDTRLPQFILAPCHLNVLYQVEKKSDFFLLHLEVNGELTIECQRCLQSFCYPYYHQSSLAICRSEERAEALMEEYEPIVSSDSQIDLNELVIDELYLYAPEAHKVLEHCVSATGSI